jgi:hypothetical protein
MTSSWQIKEGHLALRWVGRTETAKYDAPWIRTASDVQGSYLPPIPDFASHSPFGSPSGFWFLPRGYYCSPR